MAWTLVLHFFERLVGEFFRETKVFRVEREFFVSLLAPLPEPPDFAAALEVFGRLGTGSSWAFHHREKVATSTR